MNTTTVPFTLAPAPCRCDELARDPRFHRRGFELKGRCTPARRFCWSCAACGSGPYSYDPRHREVPLFTKSILTPGVVQGVLLEFCSAACAQTLNRVNVAALAPAAPAGRPSVDQAPLDLETVERLLTPAAHQRLVVLAQGRLASVRQVLIETLNELEAQGQLELVPVGTRSMLDLVRVQLKHLGEAAAPAPRVDWVPLLDHTHSHLERLAARRDQPLECFVADAIEWALEHFGLGGNGHG